MSYTCPFCLFRPPCKTCAYSSSVWSWRDPLELIKVMSYTLTEPKGGLFYAQETIYCRTDHHEAA